MKKILIVLLTCLVLFGCQKKEEQPVIEEKVVTLWTHWKLDSVSVNETAYRELFSDLSDEEFNQKMEEFNSILSIENSMIKEITFNKDGTYTSDSLEGSFDNYNNQITLYGTLYDEPIMINYEYELNEDGLTITSGKEIYHYVEV